MFGAGAGTAAVTTFVPSAPAQAPKRAENIDLEFVAFNRNDVDYDELLIALSHRVQTLRTRLFDMLNQRADLSRHL